MERLNVRSREMAESRMRLASLTGDWQQMALAAGRIMQIRILEYRRQKEAELGARLTPTVTGPISGNT